MRLLLATRFDSILRESVRAALEPAILPAALKVKLPFLTLYLTMVPPVDRFVCECCMLEV